jgi:cobyrinic acid a,c-diamide synthase
LIATMPRQEKSLPERHLGLVMPDEVAGLDELMNHLADQLTLDASIWNVLAPSAIESSVPSPIAPLLTGKQIAIARDAAFAFIYPANLECLRKMGATLNFFSPLANEPVPVGADAVYLPGGYPELHAKTLSGAEVWSNSIRQCHANGTPIWAECGGMMALADTLIDLAGKAWSMAGVMPGTSTMQTRLAGLGPQGLTMPSGQLRGHTFHYSTLATTLEPDAHTIKHTTGLPGEAVYKSGSLSASYFHAYFPSCPAAAASLFTKDF